MFTWICSTDLIENKALAAEWLLGKKWFIEFYLINLCIRLLEQLYILFSSSLALTLLQYHYPYFWNLIDLLRTLLKRVSFNQVMVKRQRTAFPPNFVHSLDGSHMMMTAVACKRQGLYFAGLYFTICRSICGILVCISASYCQHLFINAGVHDSYWTHACDVDTMNKILREKFVELYDAPILENVCIFPSQLFTRILRIPFNTVI